MEKDKVFFAENGLTTTSANHISNLCKEAYQELETRLGEMVFFTSTVRLIGSDRADTLREGVSKDFLDQMEPSLKKIAQLKSLIAWLREAIKAKDRLVNEAKAAKDEEICEILGIEFPQEPERRQRLTEDDVVASWNIKKRNHYLWLETMCAVYGAYIHPKGPFNRERENLFKVDTCRNEVQGQGRDTIVFHYIPSVTMDEVNERYFALQSKHREYQAELNSIKHDIEETLNNDNREKSMLEEKESQEYSAKYIEMLAKVKVYKNEKVLEAQKLKIAIPDSLKSVYDEVSMLGK